MPEKAIMEGSKVVPGMTRRADWEPYDPTWLVELAREQLAEEEEVDADNHKSMLTL